MSKVEIYAIVLAVSVIAVRLYMKYIKKEKGKEGTGVKTTKDSVLTSPSKDDDYEPYAKQ